MLTGFVCWGAWLQECAGERVQGIPAVVGKAFAAPQGRAACIVLVAIVFVFIVLVPGSALSAALLHPHPSGRSAALCVLWCTVS